MMKPISEYSRRRDSAHTRLGLDDPDLRGAYLGIFEARREIRFYRLTGSGVETGDMRRASPRLGQPRQLLHTNISRARLLADQLCYGWVLHDAERPVHQLNEAVRHDADEDGSECPWFTASAARIVQLTGSSPRSSGWPMNMAFAIFK